MNPTPLHIESNRKSLSAIYWRYRDLQRACTQTEGRISSLAGACAVLEGLEPSTIHRSINILALPKDLAPTETTVGELLTKYRAFLTEAVVELREHQTAAQSFFKANEDVLGLHP